LAITKPAERDLRNPSSDDLRRINAAFEAMRADPYGGDVKFLGSTGGALRRRVGHGVFSSRCISASERW
jgi:hypothetical protein